MSILINKNSELKLENQKLNIEINKLERKIDELCFVIKNNLQEYIGRPTFYQQIFSVKNEGKHKVIRLLGIKISLKKTHGDKIC